MQGISRPNCTQIAPLLRHARRRIRFYRSAVFPFGKSIVPRPIVVGGKEKWKQDNIERTTFRRFAQLYIKIVENGFLIVTHDKEETVAGFSQTWDTLRAHSLIILYTKNVKT